MFDSDRVPLPKGTRVVLRREVTGPDGHVFRPASSGILRSSLEGVFELEMPSGRVLEVKREAFTVPRAEEAQLARRDWDHRRYRGHVIYSAVVGSQAWGLADATSDVDVRGCFLLPFEDHAGLYEPPGEIHDVGHEEAYWEAERFVRQALKADPNTLETLWSPLVRSATPQGVKLKQAREAFSSSRVLGSFGRYAQSQFQKIERSRVREENAVRLLEAIRSGRNLDRDGASEMFGGGRAGRDELKALLGSFRDRGLLVDASLEGLVAAVRDVGDERFQPAPHRPKNAYNLLRLLASCEHWLRAGVPLIEVEGGLKDRLLAIKRGEVPIEQTLSWARVQAERVEEASLHSVLPEQPDIERADALLRGMRRSVVAVQASDERPVSPPSGGEQAFPVPLPRDVDVDSLRRFLERERADGWTPLWLSLTGAHAYGFPSPDSDLDLKGVHRVEARALLGLEPRVGPRNRLEVFEGREHDLTTLELGKVAELLLRGNGNCIEQLLGPFPVWITDAGRALRDWVREHPSRCAYGHYRGFLKQMLRAYEKEKAAGQRRAKRLLYAYRVGWSGRYWLETGRMEMDVRVLGERFGTEGLEALLEVKSGAEKGCLPESMDEALFLSELEHIGRALHEAHASSRLPDQPDRDSLQALLLELRGV